MKSWMFELNLTDKLKKKMWLQKPNELLNTKDTRTFTKSLVIPLVFLATINVLNM